MYIFGSTTLLTGRPQYINVQQEEGSHFSLPASRKGGTVAKTRKHLIT